MYLEDLELLQANDMASMAMLLETLTGGESAYLLQETEMSVEKVDIETNETTFKIQGGAAMVNGELVEWAETTVTVATWNDPLYLCVRRSEEDSRTFEDGQTRSCQTKTEGYMSVDNSGAAESYLVWDLPVMSKLMRKALGLSDEGSYKQLKVTFRNGYTGTVAYKELADTYRYKIDIRSSTTTAISGSVGLFYADTLPGAKSGAFCTPTHAFVATENGVADFDLYAFEGEVRARVQLPCDDVSSAADLPVKMIFDLPK